MILSVMYLDVNATASHSGAATTDTTRVGLTPIANKEISTNIVEQICTVQNQPSQLAFLDNGLIVLIFSHIRLRSFH